MDKIIGFVGRKGSGKTTYASVLVELLGLYGKNVCRRSIAGKLKEDLSRLVYEYQRGELVDECLMKLLTNYKFPVVEDECGFMKCLEDRKSKECYRKLLQDYADEIKLRNGVDYYLKCLESTLPADCIVVIDDVRFVYEMEWIRCRGGLVIYLYTIYERVGNVVDNHNSEQVNVYSYDYDFIIYNEYNQTRILPYLYSFLDKFQEFFIND